MYIRDFYADQMWMFVPAQAIVGEFLATFKDFPPATGDSLSIEGVMEEMKRGSSRQ